MSAKAIKLSNRFWNFFYHRGRIIGLQRNNEIRRNQIKKSFKRLAGANKEQLNQFANNGIDVHWPDLDEDLSLRGFLKYELAKMDTPLMV
jgi:hypothetical protein